MLKAERQALIDLNLYAVALADMASEKGDLCEAIRGFLVISEKIDKVLNMELKPVVENSRQIQESQEDRNLLKGMDGWEHDKEQGIIGRVVPRR